MLTESWLLSQEKVIKSLLTFPDFSLIFSLTFYDFSVISQSNKIDLSQWKVREKSEISLTLHDFFLTFPSTFFDWNSTSQSIKSQLKSSKLLDFYQHCLTFPWTFLDFLWLLSQVSVKKNGLQSTKSQWKVNWLLTDFWLTCFFTEADPSTMEFVAEHYVFIDPESVWMGWGASYICFLALIAVVHVYCDRSGPMVCKFRYMNWFLQKK